MHNKELHLWFRVLLYRIGKGAKGQLLGEGVVFVALDLLGQLDSILHNAGAGYRI